MVKSWHPAVSWHFFPSKNPTPFSTTKTWASTPGTPTNVINMAFGSQRVATNGPAGTIQLGDKQVFKAVDTAQQKFEAINT